MDYDYGHFTGSFDECLQSEIKNGLCIAVSYDWFSIYLNKEKYVFIFTMPHFPALFSS